MLSQISHVPSRCGDKTIHYLIFFITGNPGLISYYETFLESLNYLLSSAPSTDGAATPAFHIFGQSLAGFDDEVLPFEPDRGRRAPYRLSDEIDFVLDILQRQKIAVGEREGEDFDGVILIGHSVGSYILLEILRKLRNAKHRNSELKIAGGILLFPTVTHIAQSPNGKILVALLRIPNFPRNASIQAKWLLWPIPRTMLKWLVGFVTGMPQDAAETTTRFLTSKKGVLQALTMAQDEMEIITEDRWDEDIWGVEHREPNSDMGIPKLTFYFAQNDNWVANHTRDTLIAARAQDENQMKSSKPKMLIDLDGIPHAFCIGHSELVAEKVRSWVDEMVQNDHL